MRGLFAWTTGRMPQYRAIPACDLKPWTTRRRTDTEVRHQMFTF
jgi:hypothetical protein